MRITDDTTPWQIGERMGWEAEEHEGRILLEILRREGETDTDAISAEQWDKYLQ